MSLVKFEDSCSMKLGIFSRAVDSPEAALQTAPTALHSIFSIWPVSVVFPIQLTLIITLTGSLLPGQRPWIMMKAVTSELGFRTNKNEIAVHHLKTPATQSLCVWQESPVISFDWSGVRSTVISSPEQQIDGSSYCKSEGKICISLGGKVHGQIISLSQN